MTKYPRKITILINILLPCLATAVVGVSPADVRRTANHLLHGMTPKEDRHRQRSIHEREKKPITGEPRRPNTGQAVIYLLKAYNRVNRIASAQGGYDHRDNYSRETTPMRFLTRARSVLK